MTHVAEDVGPEVRTGPGDTARREACATLGG